MLEDNKALVSSNANYIQTIDLKNDMSCGRKTYIGNQCRSIGCRRGEIWVRSDKNKLITLNVSSGSQVRIIDLTIDPWDICVHQSGDVYFTTFGGSAVYAVTTEGEERQVYFSSELVGTNGLAVDDQGYVYVVGWATNNVHRISPDGKDHDIVLTSDDGIKNPSALAYNSASHELMVINNDSQSVLLFNIS